MALLDLENVSGLLELYLGNKSSRTLCVFDIHSSQLSVCLAELPPHLIKSIVFKRLKINAMPSK